MNHGIAVKKNSKDLPGWYHGRFSFANTKGRLCTREKIPICGDHPRRITTGLRFGYESGWDACSVYGCDIHHGPGDFAILSPARRLFDLGDSRMGQGAAFKHRRSVERHRV